MCLDNLFECPHMCISLHTYDISTRELCLNHGFPPGLGGSGEKLTNRRPLLFAADSD